MINPCNAYNINQDSGARVLILEGFWVLKLVFEWCRIHIKTVLAQHYSLVVFYPILLWLTYAWFIQATPVQVGPGPPESAQVNTNLQVLPGSPRFSQEISDFLRFCGFPGFPGRTWVLFSAILWGFRDFLEEPGWISWENLGIIFCAFLGFPGFPGRTWVETVGDGPGRAARVCSGKIGRRVARYFDPQFLNFCRRRCCPLWPAGLPRFKV